MQGMLPGRAEERETEEEVGRKRPGVDWPELENRGKVVGL